MAKGKKRNAAHFEKQRKKTEAYLRRGGANGESRYARKRRMLDKLGKWGWEVPEPKPWGSKQ